MTGASRSRTLAVSLALAAALGASACTTYRVETAPPAQVVAQRQPKSVIIELRSGREVELFGPVVLQDSLRGHPRAEAVQRLTFALADIATIQSRHFNLGKSLLVTAGVAGGLLVYDWLMGLNGTTP